MKLHLNRWPQHLIQAAKHKLEPDRPLGYIWLESEIGWDGSILVFKDGTILFLCLVEEIEWFYSLFGWNLEEYDY